MKIHGPVWNGLRLVLALGVLFSLGGNQAAASAPLFAEGSSQAASLDCATQTVRMTLAGEQITFCAPTRLPFSASEDSRSDANVHYAGLDQLGDFASINIRAVRPGNAAGPDMPFYASGGLDDYRQAVRKSQATQTASRLSSGPTASLWDEKAASLQVDYTLSTSKGSLSLRTIEWDVEHNGRLWVFHFTWDKSLSNSGEWEAAAKNFTVHDSTALKMMDTAIDLGKVTGAATSQPGRIQTTSGPRDVPAPSWWSGACDKDNYMADPNTHSQEPYSVGNWHGVDACFPKTYVSPYPSHLVHFFPDAWGESEFECVELVMRFLYLEWAIAPWSGDGKTIKDSPPSSLIFYTNGTHPIIPGDIITEDGSSDLDGGHTMVVTGVSVNGSGTGTVTILEQNSNPRIHPYGDLVVTNWVMSTDSWTGKTVQGWLHAIVNTPDPIPGDPDPSFSLTGSGDHSGLLGPVYAMGVQSDTKIILGGAFVGYNGAPLNNLGRLNSDGSLDGTFNPNNGVLYSTAQGNIFALKIQPSDNKVVIAGQFDHYYDGSTARKNIARVNADGTNDPGFTPPSTVTATSGNPIIRALAIQPSDGKIIIGGDFNTLNSATHNFIARLQNNGTVDPTFTATTDGIVYSISLQSDGKILIGGTFSHVNGSARAGIARIDQATGALDAGFAPTGIGPAGHSVNSIALQSIASPDDKILLAGDFSTVNGTARSMVARLNSNGTLDSTFNPGTGVAGSAANLQSVVPQPDGRILIGGHFSSYNGSPMDNFIRLNYDGSRDTTYFPLGDFSTTDAGKVVNAVLLQADNKILIGGDYSSSNNVTRLLNEILPCYSLNTFVSPAAPPVAGGSVSVNLAPNCPGSKYISGTGVNLTETPNFVLGVNEFHFIGWSGDASGTANPLAVTMNGNKSITANFLDPPHAFNKLAPPNGGPDALGLVVVLSWQPSAGATSYEICVVDAAGPNAGKCDNDDNASIWQSVGANTSFTVMPIQALHTYQWNVRARNQVDTTHGGAAWSFTRDGTSVPNQIYLPLVSK